MVFALRPEKRRPAQKTVRPSRSSRSENRRSIYMTHIMAGADMHQCAPDAIPRPKSERSQRRPPAVAGRQGNRDRVDVDARRGRILGRRQGRPCRR